MLTPIVLRCPDGHFRRVIFGLGAYIADYPEQVSLSGVISDWCPKCVFSFAYAPSLSCSNYSSRRCTAYRDDLDGPGVTRTQSLYEELMDLLDASELRTEYGINAAVEVCLLVGWQLLSIFPQTYSHLTVALYTRPSSCGHP